MIRKVFVPCVLAIASCRSATVSSADSAAIGAALAQRVRPTHDTVPTHISASAGAGLGLLGRSFVNTVMQADAQPFVGPPECAPRLYRAALESVSIHSNSAATLVLGMRREDRRTANGDGVRAEYHLARDRNGTWHVADHRELVQADLVVAERPSTCAP